MNCRAVSLSSAPRLSPTLSRPLPSACINATPRRHVIVSDRITVGELVQQASDDAKAQTDKVGKAISEGAKTVTDKAEEVGHAIGDHAKNVTGQATDVPSQVKGQAEKLGKEVGKHAENLKDAALDGVDKLGNAISEQARAAQ